MAKFQTLPNGTLNTAPFSIVKLPAEPDHMAVPVRLTVRLESTGLAEVGKLMPASRLSVAFVPKTQDVLLEAEQINPLDQFKGVEKFRTPGAAPVRAPAVRFTVFVEMVVFPEPKFIVAPLKLTIPRPLIGPLCANTLELKLIVPLVPAE